MKISDLTMRPGKVRRIEVDQTRREWLAASFVKGGIILCGTIQIAGQRSPPTEGVGFAGGEVLGAVEFIHEGSPPMDTPFGAELDGRLLTDLSKLTPARPTSPTEKFYIRTRASELLDLRNPWYVKVQSTRFTVEELIHESAPRGAHLMECAGNTRSARFGLIGVAEWTGVSMAKLLNRVGIGNRKARVLVSGFDTYANQSATSVPGASWIFSQEDLETSRAFLATEMNGRRLSLDHGSPVRLVVPGWYGCCCIKWVNEIRLVDGGAEVTPHMREYAMRTHQEGIPTLAMEYEPARIDPAAMPILVQKWLVRGGTGYRIRYRIVGIVWGGPRSRSGLEIQFNPHEDYVPVRDVHPAANDTWGFWSHPWAPQHVGAYAIRLRASGRNVRTRRLDSGFYVRRVQITQI